MIVEAARELADAAALMQDGDCTSAATLYLDVAQRFAQAGQGPQALALGFLALRLDPTQMVALAIGPLIDQLGVGARGLCKAAIAAHVAARRANDAAELMLRLVAVSPRCAQTQRRLAEQLAAAGRYPEAIAALENCARMLSEDGNNAGLLATAVRTLELDPNHRGGLRDLVLVTARLEGPNAAMPATARLLRTYSHDRVGLELFARSLVLRRHDESAVEVLTRLARRLAQRDPTRADDVIHRARRWPWNNEHCRVALAAWNRDLPAPLDEFEILPELPQRRPPPPPPDDEIQLSLEDLIPL